MYIDPKLCYCYYYDYYYYCDVTVKLLDQEVACWTGCQVCEKKKQTSGNQENCEEISCPVRNLASFTEHFTADLATLLLLQHFSRRCPSAQNVWMLCRILVPRPLPPSLPLISFFSTPSPTLVSLQWSGASATTPSTTAACRCGSSRTTAARCASRTGWSRGSESERARPPPLQAPRPHSPALFFFSPPQPPLQTQVWGETGK